MHPSLPRRARRAAVASAALSAGLLVPTAAHATVTTTNVTSPAPESVFDTAFTNSSGVANVPMTITGTAPGADDGDPLTIVCTYTLNGATYLQRLDYGRDSAITVEDGAFSASDIDTPTLPCRVRAVPADTYDEYEPEDVDLSAFSGPRLIAGGYVALTQDGGPNDGAQTYQTIRGQTKGLGFVTGLGGGNSGFFGAFGGIYLTALLDDTYYRPLFGPTAYLYDLSGGFGGPSAPTSDNLGLIVDGTPATPVPAVGDQRSKVLSRTFDPTTADQTVVEEAPIATAETDDDGNVTGFVDSGLTLRRTIAQDREGRRFTIRDEYVSRDGAAHHLEARYLQTLYSSLFGNVGGPGGDGIQEPPSYRFPWATGDAYVQPGAGDEIAQAPAGPTTILVHGARQDYSVIFDRKRRADAPLLPRAEGAYVFDSAPSNIKFLETGVFTANFVRDVPAGGSAAVGQTALQDLTQDGLQGLLTPPAPPSGPAPAPPLPATAPLPTQAPKLPINPLPILARSTGRVLLTPAQGRRLRDRKPVTVTTKGMPAGRYGVTIRRRVPKGRTIASGLRTIKTDGTLKVTLRLTKYGRKYLAQKKTRKAKSVPVRVIVTWTPPGQGRKREQTSYPTNFR
jgi:hypothetical protein